MYVCTWAQSASSLCLCVCFLLGCFYVTEHNPRPSHTRCHQQSYRDFAFFYSHCVFFYWQEFQPETRTISEAVAFSVSICPQILSWKRLCDRHAKIYAFLRLSRRGNGRATGSKLRALSPLLWWRMVWCSLYAGGDKERSVEEPFPSIWNILNGSYHGGWRRCFRVTGLSNLPKQRGPVRPQPECPAESVVWSPARLIRRLATAYIKKGVLFFWTIAHSVGFLAFAVTIINNSRLYLNQCELAQTPTLLCLQQSSRWTNCECGADLEPVCTRAKTSEDLTCDGWEAFERLWPFRVNRAIESRYIQRQNLKTIVPWSPANKRAAPWQWNEKLP